MSVLWNILSGVGNVLDLPGSMVRDVAGFENPLDQILTPWRDDNRLSGRDLLRKWGAAGPTDTWGNLAGGIGVELALDPLNVIPGAGVLSRILKGAKIAKATRAVDRANTFSQALRAKGWMPEEVAQATKIRGTAYDAYDDTGKLLGTHPSVQAAQGQAWNESEHALNSRIAAKDVGPARVYHETAAPLFEPHQFASDPGTNNWMGKGTYFTMQPGEAAGAYSKWDKSGTIMPNEPGSFVPAGEPSAIIQAFRKHMPESYFKNITPSLEREILPEVGATALRNPQGYPKTLVETLRPLYRQSSPILDESSAADEAAEFLAKQYNTPIHEITDGSSVEEVMDEALANGWKPTGQLKSMGYTPNTGESAPRTMMAFVDARNPYKFEEPATLKDMLMAARTTREAGGKGRELREITRQQGLKMPRMPDEFVESLRELRGQSAQGGLTKGDLWALLHSQGEQPDEITDILRESGYDALMHEPGTGSKIQERMYDIGRQAPDIDEHSELVAFSPSQIYSPYIAPALQARPEQLKKVPGALKAILAAYQAGILPARGRSRPLENSEELE